MHGDRLKNAEHQRRGVWGLVAAGAFSIFVVLAMADRAPEDADAPSEPSIPVAACEIIGSTALTLDGHLTSHDVYEIVDRDNGCPLEPILDAINDDPRNKDLPIGHLTGPDKIGDELYVPIIAGTTTTTQQN